MLDATPYYSAATPISRFRRDDVIARGEAATTYRAHDSVSGQLVTLFEFHPDQIVDPSIERSFSSRFAREAQVLAAIKHPNVMRVVAWGNEFGQPYLAGELLPGRTLAESIDHHGAFSGSDAVTIVSQIVAGLRAIHAAGLLHLKLTPHAIHLGDDGIVRITDIGLTAPSSLNSATNAAERLDLDRYQAPELLDGLDVSEATDVYAVGAILYQTLTGQAPFPGANAVLVRFAQMQSAPPVPSRLVTHDIPPGLDQIVVRALAKQAADRFVDAPAMLHALDDVVWQLTPEPNEPIAPSAVTAPLSYETTHFNGAVTPPLRFQQTAHATDAGYRPLTRRARQTNSGWVVPMVIAGLAIAVLIGGLVRNLTGEQPLEAVAGVSVMETTTPSPTATVALSPTARVVNAAKDDAAAATKTPSNKQKATVKATKTPKPTRTPKSTNDD